MTWRETTSSSWASWKIWLERLLWSARAKIHWLDREADLGTHSVMRRVQGCHHPPISKPTKQSIKHNFTHKKVPRTDYSAPHSQPQPVSTRAPSQTQRPLGASSAIQIIWVWWCREAARRRGHARRGAGVARARSGSCLRLWRGVPWWIRMCWIIPQAILSLRIIAHW